MRRIGVILALLTALWAVDAVLGMGTFWAHDLRHHHVPWRVWAAAEWLDGRVPLWCPDVGNGFPLTADGQTGTFYLPTMLLFMMFSSTWAVNLSILLHVWWAGLGMVRLMHALGVRGPAALLPAVAFAFSGFMATHAGYLGMQNAAAWLPWLLAATVEARVLSIGMAGAMIAVAGHPQIAVMGAMTAIAVALWRRTVRPLVTGGLLSVVAASPQILATAELVKHSMREGGVSQAFAAIGSLPPQELINGVLPTFFGLDRPGDIAQTYFHRGDGYWGAGANHWDMAFYLGIPVLILAVLGARGRRFWIGLAGGAGLLMLGSATPLWTILRQLPVLDSMRFPARFSLVLTLAVAVLAGHGLNRLLNEAKPVQLARRLAVLSIVFVVSMAGLHGAANLGEEDLRSAATTHFENRDQRTVPTAGPLEGAALPTPEPMSDEDITRRVEQIVTGFKTATHPLSPGVLAPAGMVLLMGVLVLGRNRGWLAGSTLAMGVLCLAYADLWAFGAGYNIRTHPLEAMRKPVAMARMGSQLTMGRTTVVDRRRHPSLDGELMSSSMGLLYGTRDVIVTSPLLLPRNEALLARVGLDVGDRGPQKWTRLADNKNLVDLMGVRWLLSEHPTKTAGLLQHMTDPIHVYENPMALPSAFVVGCVEETSDPWGALTSLDPRNWAVVEDTVDVQDCRNGAGVGQVVPVEISPNRIELNVQASTPAMLVQTDTHFPGWSASVDGTEVLLHRVNWMFRGVVVPEGEHTVVLRYEPEWKAGTVMPAGLVWCVLLLGVIPRRRSLLESSVQAMEE